MTIDTFSIEETLLRAEQQFLPKTETLRILDLGCGHKGSIAVTAIEAVRPKTDATYLDQNENAIKELKKPRKVCADAIKTGLPSESFDMIAAFDVVAGGIINRRIYGHCKPVAIAKEACRLLAPQGIWVFNVVAIDADVLHKSQANLLKAGFSALDYIGRVDTPGPLPEYALVAIK